MILARCLDMLQVTELILLLMGMSSALSLLILGSP